MDKLKPILAQHFWILFVVVMCLPIVGWWGATAGFDAETAAMKEKVENAFKSVNYGENIPNDRWASKVTPYIENQEERNAEALEACWEQQVPLMKWPSTLRVPETFYGDFSAISRNIYRAEYPLEVERVFNSVDPYDSEEGKGTILFEMSRFPHRVFGDLPPSSQQMWEAQQDLWLFESLFKAIRKVNEGSTIVTESAIRSIEKIELVGGDGEPVVEQTEGSADGSDDGAYAPPSAVSRRSSGSTSVAFDPASELGSSEDPNASSDESSSSEEYTGPGGVGSSEEEGLRYVGPQEGGTYLKRGFYLEVVMQHNRVSDLLIELSNADFPVAIKRFQFAGNNASQGTSYASGSADSYDGDYLENPSDSGFRRSNSRRESIGGNSFTTRKGRSQNIEQAAVASGQLVRVAVCGEMVLYNPPPTPEAATEEVPPEPEEGTAESESETTPGAADAPMDGEKNTPEAENETSNGGTNGSDPASETKNEESGAPNLPIADPLESAPSVPDAPGGDSKSGETPPSENTNEANTGN